MALSDVKPKGNLVAEWEQGNVKVRIFDDAYANRTDLEIRQTIQRMVQINWQMLEVAGTNGAEIVF